MRHFGGYQKAEGLSKHQRPPSIIKDDGGCHANHTDSLLACIWLLLHIVLAVNPELFTDLAKKA